MAFEVMAHKIIHKIYWSWCVILVGFIEAHVKVVNEEKTQKELEAHKTH